MSPIRGRLLIRRRNDRKMVVDVSPYRRGFYLLIALVLILGLYVSGSLIDTITHFNVATAVYLGVILLSLGVGGWNARTTIDRESALITRSYHLFGVRLHRREYRTDDVSHLLLRRIVLFRGRKHDAGTDGKPAVLGIGGGKRFSRREVGRLFLVLPADRMEMLDESSDAGELWKLADAIREFSGLPFQTEEI